MKALITLRFFASKSGPQQFALVSRKADQLLKISPAIKEVLDKQMPDNDFMKLDDGTTVSPHLLQPKFQASTYLLHMVTNFEVFFQQRSYTEKNFCFYLQVLAQQKKPIEAQEAFEKMLTLNISPTDHVFTQLMLAYAKTGNLQRVLELENQAYNEFKILPSVHRLNSVITAYVKSRKPVEAEHFINEMRDKHGVQPDVVSYTTLIDGYRLVNNIDKCWELFEQCNQRVKKGMDIDEQLLGYMIRICAATHDSEKALLMFNNLQLDGFIEHSKPYNAIILACASTKRYAPKAIEYWHVMHAKNIMADQMTYIAVLKACAQLGDTQTAYDALQELKLNGLKIDALIYNQLIKVYAGACMQDNVQDKHIQMYVNDGWALYQQMVKETDYEPSIHHLNSLTLLFTQALQVEQLEQKVLPLFAKNRIAMDVYTYQHIMKMYLNMRELDQVISLFEKCKAAGITPNKLLLNTVLEVGLRKADSDLIYDTLKMYIQLKKEPHDRQLAKLANLKQIPDRLYVLLRQNFNVQGNIGLKIRQFETPSYRPNAVGKLGTNLRPKFKKESLKRSRTTYGKATYKQIKII